MPSVIETKLFICGDVMTGRGIDQILPCPADPQLHEPYVRSALDYVRIAEALNGPIPHFVTLDECDQLVNVEMVATQMKNFRLNLASVSDAQWLCAVLRRECRRFGASVMIGPNSRMALSRLDRSKTGA